MSTWVHVRHVLTHVCVCRMYEVCFGRHVRQFEKEGTVSNMLGVRYADVSAMCPLSHHL